MRDGDRDTVVEEGDGRIVGGREREDEDTERRGKKSGRDKRTRRRGLTWWSSPALRRGTAEKRRTEERNGTKSGGREGGMGESRESEIKT